MCKYVRNSEKEVMTCLHTLNEICENMGEYGSVKSCIFVNVFYCASASKLTSCFSLLVTQVSSGKELLQITFSLNHFLHMSKDSNEPSLFFENSEFKLRFFS